MPYPSQTAIDFSRQQTSAEALQAILFRDPQMMGALNTMGMPFTGGVPLEQIFQRNPTVGYVGQAVGSYLQERLSQKFPGVVGSPMKLAAGAAYAAGTFKYQGGGMAGQNLQDGAQIELAKAMADRMGSAYYDSSGKLKNEARGFRQQDWGQLLAEMSNRGMFSDLAPMVHGTFQDQDQIKRELESAVARKDTRQIEFLKQAKVGDSFYRLDSSEMDRMMSRVQGGLDLASKARGVFGDRPMQELLGLTEYTTGRSISTAEGRKAAINTFQQVTSQADALNINPGDYMQMGGAALETMSRIGGNNGLDSQMSGSAASVFMADAMRVGASAFESNQRMRGFDAGVDAVSREDAVGFAMARMMDTSLNNFEAVAAAHAADTEGIGSEDRARLDQHLSDLKNAKTEDAKTAAREKLNKFTEMLTGQDAATYAEANGGALNMIGDLSEDFRKQISSTMAGLSGTEAREKFSELAAGLGTADRLGVSSDAAGEKMSRFFGLLDAGTQQGIIDAFGSKDPNAQQTITSRLKAAGYDASSLGMSPEQYAAELAGDNQRATEKSGGKTNLSGALKAFRRGLGNIGADVFANRNQISSLDQSAADRALINQSMGDAETTNKGFAENVLIGAQDAAQARMKPTVTPTPEKGAGAFTLEAAVAEHERDNPGVNIKNAELVARHRPGEEHSMTPGLEDMVVRQNYGDAPRELKRGGHMDYRSNEDALETRDSKKSLQNNLDKKTDQKPIPVYVVNIAAESGFDNLKLAEL